MEAITTREAAEILETDPANALTLLKVAKVPYRPLQSGGQIHQYLWDAQSVRQLKAILADRIEGENNE